MSSSQALTDLLSSKYGYELVQKLGSGRYSKVYLVKGRLDGVRKAVKLVNRSRIPAEVVSKFLSRELVNWSRLAHPNIVSLHTFFNVAHWTVMVAEYVDGGDLLDHVQQTNLTEAQAHHYAVQIVSALHYLHVIIHIAHRDLKLENIMISADKTTVKLGDFGFSCHLPPTGLTSTTCGSRAYMSPDILMGLPYSPLKADIWSLGVVVYVLLSGHLPFDESVAIAVLLDLQQNPNLKYLKVSYTPTSPLGVAFVAKLLTAEPSKRPDIEEVQQHPWITQIP